MMTQSREDLLRKLSSLQRQYDFLKLQNQNLSVQNAKLKKHNCALTKTFQQQEALQSATLQLGRAQIRKAQAKAREVSQKLSNYQYVLLPMVDSDALRVKILNELQDHHQGQLRLKQQQLARALQRAMELKRQNDILGRKMQSLRMRAERDLKELKIKHRQETSILLLQIQALKASLDVIKS